MVIVASSLGGVIVLGLAFLFTKRTTGENLMFVPTKECFPPCSLCKYRIQAEDQGELANAHIEHVRSYCKSHFDQKYEILRKKEDWIKGVSL